MVDSQFTEDSELMDFNEQVWRVLRERGQRVWFWLLVVVVLGVGGCISALAIGTAAVNKANSTQHTVVYTVTGPGTADITYSSFSNGNVGSAQATGVKLPWTKTVVGSGLFSSYDVTATVDSGSSVTCSITVDGKRATTNTGSGQFASADCTATP